MLTLARLREVLRYDPESGLWTWLVDRSPKVSAGVPAGYPSTGGYIQIYIDGAYYMAHRLAWFYVNGEWPPRRLDHENRTPADNRWINLRLATRSQNAANSKVRRNNELGLKGVVRTLRKHKPFRAMVTKKGRRVHVGYFKTPEQASAAYFKKAQELFGEFACRG